VADIRDNFAANSKLQAAEDLGCLLGRCYACTCMARVELQRCSCMQLAPTVRRAPACLTRQQCILAVEISQSSAPCGIRIAAHGLCRNVTALEGAIYTATLKRCMRLRAGRYELHVFSRCGILRGFLRGLLQVFRNLPSRHDHHVARIMETCR